MKAKDLKNSILQMAVEGKLVPQDPNDEPASVLLERIREEKHRLIAEGKAKFPKGGESIIYTASDGSPYEKRVDAKGRILSDESIADEVPFELPEGWCWARLGNLLSLVSDGTHKTPRYTESGVLFLSVQNISGGSFDLTKVRHVSQETHEELCKRVKPSRGDILLCRIGTLGKPIIVDVDYEFSIFVSLGLLRPISVAIAKWICSCIDSPIGFAWIESVKVGGGTHTFKINLGDIPDFLLPLPPLAEQRRIAERVSELMPLVEAYGELEDAREALDAALPDRLRRSVLQEAVRGRLAPQDPSDEPAGELLGRIRAERRKLASEGTMRLPKGGDSVIFTGSDGRRYEKRVDARGRESGPVCIEDEIPFEIPEGWAWARLKSLGAVVGGGTPKTSDATLWAQSDTGIPWITPADMKNVTNMQVSHGARYLSEKGLCASSAQLIPAGSIVMSSRAPIGYLAITACEIATNQGFKSLVPVKRSMNRWILICLDAQMMDIQRRASGTTFKEISGTEFGETLLPIAPLPEQERVMNNVNSLIDLML